MISKKHVYEEILAPKEVEKLKEPSMLGLIYKAVYMCIRILLEIRFNQVRLAESLGKPLKEWKEDEIQKT